MSEGAKKTARSFLDKFQGRTNKVGKTGMKGVLFSDDIKSSKANKEDAGQIKHIDLDALIPSNPEKALNVGNNRKRNQITRPPIKTQTKYEYIPSTYGPEYNSIKSETSQKLVTRTNSQSSTGSYRGKYAFGKYLKLDPDALSHMQFLDSLENNPFIKRSQKSGISKLY